MVPTCWPSGVGQEGTNDDNDVRKAMCDGRGRQRLVFLTIVASRPGSNQIGSIYEGSNALLLCSTGDLFAFVKHIVATVAQTAFLPHFDFVRTVSSSFDGSGLTESRYVE